MAIALWWLVLVGVPLLGALAVRRAVRAARRRRGRPPTSLAEELRPLLLLPVAWGALLGLGVVLARRGCSAQLVSAELAEGVTAAEYCEAWVGDQLPGIVTAASLLVGLLALLWPATVLVLRARERRRTTVG